MGSSPIRFSWGYFLVLGRELTEGLGDADRVLQDGQQETTSEVQSVRLRPILQLGQNAQGLPIALEPTVVPHEQIELALAIMPEGGMSQVMGEGACLHQASRRQRECKVALTVTKVVGDPSSDLCDL